MFGVLIKFFCVSISEVVCLSDWFQDGKTALHDAAGQGEKMVVKFLMENGASVNAQDNVSINGEGKY